MSAQPVRVAFCHYTSDIAGGSDRSLFDLVTHLPRERIAPCVILRRGDPMADAYTKSRVPVYEVALVHPRRTKNLAYQLRFAATYAPSVFAVRRAIREHRADLVHVNTINNVQGPTAAWLARKPLVWHIREMADANALSRAIRSMVRMLATKVVANSKAVGETLRVCGDRVQVVYNGIDLSEFDNLLERDDARRQLGFEGAPIISTVGRLEHWKGQHVLVEALPRVFAAFPGARALIVGGPAKNKPDYMPRLEKRCVELGIANAVTFTGIRSDIPLLLMASDALILPSVLPEPFGRTIVEAMAAACPVVATRAGGPLETVVDGVTGRLVNPDDPDDLAAGIIEVLSDAGKARAMGQAGRHRARDLFSLERLVNEMTTLFETMAREATGR